MDKIVTFQYSRKLAIRISKEYWLRCVAGGYFYYLGVPLVTLLLCLGSGEFGPKGKVGIVIGFLAGVTGAYALSLVQSYRHVVTSVFSKKAWANGMVKYTFGEKGIHADYGVGEVFYSWSLVELVHRLPSAWL